MIIGLTGLKNSGKGTVANILAEEYGYMQLSFASKVKQVCSVLFGWDRSMLEGDTVYSRTWREKPDTFWSEKLNMDFTPRKAMQLIGTEVFREHFHPDIWVFILEKNLSIFKDDVVVSDIRFENEAALVRKRGGVIWRIERNETNTDAHSSEMAMESIRVDAIIKNDGYIVDLEKKITELMTNEK